MKNPFKNLIFPNGYTCEICGVEIFSRRYFCEQCESKLEAVGQTRCDLCGRQTLEPCLLCIECKSDAPAFDKARSVYLYGGEARKLIIKFKNGAKYLSELMGAKMSMLALKEFFNYTIITSVPMHTADKWRRGFNQSELLCRAISNRTGIAYEGLLIKTKRTPPNKSLGRADRIKNMNGCFKVKNKLACKGQKVLLIDDVLTTGATADCITRCLKKAGAESVGLLTFASVKANVL